MQRVLILGGGFGGIQAAKTLKEKLGERVEISLVDRRPFFMAGFRKTWALTGQSTLEEGQRPLAALEKLGIHFIQGKITAIDPRERAAEVAGRRYQADALVVALGAELAPETIPGFSEHAFNVYDTADIPRAAKALQDFAGGRLLIGVFGEAYQCPPAPYEIALAARERLQARGIAAQIEVFTPLPMSLPVLGDAGCSVIEGYLEGRGITFLPGHAALEIEKGQVRFANGTRPFDLLLGVPPHRCPGVVADSGLTGGKPWIPVDAVSLQTSFEGVYAVGDNTLVTMANGKRLPMAGVFAEAQAEAAAEHIAATFEKRARQTKFEGWGSCFLEVGDGKAMKVEGQFLAQPAPQVSLTQASVEYLQEKVAFERARLASLSA